LFLCPGALGDEGLFGFGFVFFALVAVGAEVEVV
jgi:hypothetical protein